MRAKIVAGNWKMNNDLVETKSLLNTLIKEKSPDGVSLLVAPSFTNLYVASETLKNQNVQVAAQNMHQSQKGAFTGEVSAEMLKSIGVNTVILGHSERRAYFHEDNSLLSQKVDAALTANMKIIFCFGEELDDRKNNAHFDVVKSQLEEGICHINAKDWKDVVLAYEPVWAIGTGETASPEQAQEMHAFIRTVVSKAYTDTISEEVSILYGGSVKPANAKEIFGKPDVDGGLIGGAALDAESFLAIANSFE